MNIKNKELVLMCLKEINNLNTKLHKLDMYITMSEKLTNEETILLHNCIDDNCLIQNTIKEIED